MTPSYKKLKTNTPHERTTYWKQSVYTCVRLTLALRASDFMVNIQYITWRD